MLYWSHGLDENLVSFCPEVDKNKFLFIQLKKKGGINTIVDLFRTEIDSFIFVRAQVQSLPCRVNADVAESSQM